MKRIFIQSAELRINQAFLLSLNYRRTLTAWTLNNGENIGLYNAYAVGRFVRNRRHDPSLVKTDYFFAIIGGILIPFPDDCLTPMLYASKSFFLRECCYDNLSIYIFPMERLKTLKDAKLHEGDHEI